jgi:hypothetical protein
LRTSDNVPAWSWIGINGGLEIGEDLRYSLCLIEDESVTIAFEKPRGSSLASRAISGSSSER